MALSSTISALPDTDTIDNIPTLAPYLAQLSAGCCISLSAQQLTPRWRTHRSVWHSCVDGQLVAVTTQKLGHLVMSLLQLLQLCSHSLG